MAPTAFPEILYEIWFWLVVWLSLAVAICFARRKSPTPFPRIGEFLARHQRGVTRVLDILLISVVLLWSLFLPGAVKDLFNALSHPEPNRTVLLRGAWTFLFTFLIIWSGISGFFVGLLSVFQSDLTKIKRILLLILCLFPVVFTVLHVLTDIAESPWLAVQICFYCSAGSWIINAPAILVGQHFFQISGSILRKLK
jgi:hypothetical protein